MLLNSKLAQATFVLGLVVTLAANVGAAGGTAVPQRDTDSVTGISHSGVKTAAAQAPDLEAIFADVHYRDIGPTRQSGRFVSIALDPRDTNTFYAATASGGLWKTADGINFESIFHIDDVFSIGEVAIAPSAPDTVW
ncbi:MAG: hypothetical protein VX389_07805, partial [Acidobacteriota bacterium]|nr:hypothetical protein [Acidobacteriota bacterium]